MNEQEFRDRWIADKPIYDAWGTYIVKTISSELENQGKDLGSFLKIPTKHRLKDDETLVYKAFYHPDKHYEDPYNEIEDKVGARFVVLLLDGIKTICNIIENQPWQYDACKHFDEEKKEEPLLFTYQSVHYVIRPSSDLIIEDISIPVDTTCEVQIRTLLQHAHAELTHDNIYKAKKKVRPEVHRTVAKCMALIETTDEFFIKATEDLNFGPLQEYGIQDKLDAMFHSLTGYTSHQQKTSLIIWDSFEQLLDTNLIEKIEKFIRKNNHLPQTIVKQYLKGSFYQQSIVLFIYWMMATKTKRLLTDWPMSRDLLEPLATDLGISIWGR